jgi:hypothetical protein
MLPVARRVPLALVAGALLAGLLAVDLASVCAHGIGSPARGAAFLLVVAWAVGRLVWGLARGSRSPTTSFVLPIPLGVAVLALVYAAAVAAGAQRAYPIVAYGLAAAGLVVTRADRALRRRVSVRRLLVAAAVAGLALRGTWLVDRLDLTRVTTNAYPWVDTPLWLTIAHAAERTFPPEDLLFGGQRLNYHYGLGLVVGAIRGATGLSVQAAYFSALASFAVLLPAVVARTAALLFPLRARGLAVVAFAAVALTKLVVFNFPSMCALPVTVALVAVLVRMKRPGEVALVALGLGFVMLTKEVDYVLVLAVGGLVALDRAARKREALPLIALVFAVVATRPLYERLLRPDQHSKLAPFVEHLDPEWIGPEMDRVAMRVALTVALIAFAAVFVRSRPRIARVAFGAGLVYAALLGLSWAVKPVFVPPMDPFSYGWILLDMEQFELHGWFVLATTVAALVASFVGRLEGGAAGRAAATSATVGFGVLAFVSTFRSTPLAGKNPRPEERGPDPVHGLLENVPTQGTLLAAQRLNWNYENPHWAAFFGHRFYFLRRGRWATAYPDFQERWRDNDALFRMSDRDAALALAKKHGITHVVDEVSRPSPWLASERPLGENAYYRVYDLRPLAAPPTARSAP